MTFSNATTAGPGSGFGFMLVAPHIGGRLRHFFSFPLSLLSVVMQSDLSVPQFPLRKSGATGKSSSSHEFCV